MDKVKEEQQQKKEEKTITDVVRNMKNAPFITARETKIPNVWVSDKLPYLFALCSSGFRRIKGRKENIPSSLL